MEVVREGPLKITRAVVDAAWRRRAPGRRLVVADAGCRGLALVVNPTGMAWRFDFKPRGLNPATGKRFPTNSLTIGSPETHSPDEARDEANRAKGQNKAGTDPAAARRAEIDTAAEKRTRTLARLVEDYAADLPKRRKLRGNGKLSPAHARAELAHLRAAVSAMRVADKAVADIGKRDLQALLRATADMPGAARHRFGATSRFFDWALDEGHLPLNPCALIGKARRPRAVASRQDHLAPRQLAALWTAAGAVEGFGPSHRDFVRCLLALPCRRGEAGGMRWEHVDLNAAVWTQPGRLTKNGDAHRLHLHPMALSLLRARHEATGKPNSGLVFAVGGKPITSHGWVKRKLDAASGVSGWRFHDLRRSFATLLGEMGVAETVVDAILNHRQAATRGGVLGVYQRAQRWPEQAKAMEAWGAILAAAIEGREQDARVVRLPRPVTS